LSKVHPVVKSGDLKNVLAIFKQDKSCLAAILFSEKSNESIIFWIAKSASLRTRFSTETHAWMAAG
jgi:hypothetical protein